MKLALAIVLLFAVCIPTSAGIIETPGWCGATVCPDPPCTENCFQYEPDVFEVWDFVTPALDVLSLV